MAQVKLNLAGFRALRTDARTRALVQEIAERVADASGTKAVQTESPRNRARSAVVGSRRKSEAMLSALGSQMGRSL